MTDPREPIEYYKSKHEQELESQLLPCPFCGGKAKFFDYGYSVVKCGKCFASTPSCLDREYSSNFWNGRIADNRIAKLHTEIHHLKNHIAELDKELRIKQSIINKQVAMMGEMER